MLKILIVDDEILIRVGIKSCIDWAKHGYEVIGQAEDGMTALNIIKEQSPDIVLTDIKMPHMDGIELIKKIKENYSYIKIIVLSCYNELDYVKKAMKLGAEDYVLKLSMQPESLLELINNVRDKILSERSKTKDKSGLKNEVRINKYIIKEDLYKKFLEGAIGLREFEKDIAALGGMHESSRFYVICCCIDDYINAPVKSRMEDQYLLKFSFLNILEEKMTGIYKGEISEIQEGKYIILLDADGIANAGNKKNVLEDFFIKINNAVKKYLNISVSFGVADQTGMFSNLSEKYLEACTAMERKFYTGKESINFHEDMEGFINKPVLMNYEDETILLSQLESNNAEGMKNVIHKFFKCICTAGIYYPSRVKLAAAEILHSLIKVIKKLDGDMEFITVNYEKHPADIIKDFETVTEMTVWLDEFIDNLVEYFYYLRSNEERPEITKIKAYILEHFAEDITLAKAASMSNISKCYLSTIFKKQTGESFTDYVNKLKMEKAKDLILYQGLKTYEAAEQVGIFDVSYFSKLFKKYMGINPSKVKEL